MNFPFSIIGLALLGFASACSKNDNTRDVVDAALGDVGTRDAQEQDSATEVADAGVLMDAGVLDDGGMDAEIAVDATVVDARLGDASVDSGVVAVCIASCETTNACTAGEVDCAATCPVLALSGCEAPGVTYFGCIARDPCDEALLESCGGEAAMVSKCVEAFCADHPSDCRRG